MDNVAISISNLSKQYAGSKKYAVLNLSLTVRMGEIYGFIGPNGSGKSTTIRLLLNFIKPTSGTASIFGNDIVKKSLTVKKSIGYLSGEFSAYEKLTCQEFLTYMTKLQPLKHKNTPAVLSKLFNVEKHKKIQDLSKGNRQKLGIIQALMHEPDLLILDEPTDGLDPLMQEKFYSILKKMKSRGSTIFLSSHNLSEVQKICDRVAIIREGQLVAETNITDLIDNSVQTFEVTFKKPILATALRSISNVTNVSKLNSCTFRFNVKGSLSDVLTFMAKNQAIHIKTNETNLEDEFIKFYETKQ